MQAADMIEFAAMDLLANDTATLNAVARPKLHLAKAAFVPGPGLLLAGLTEADFTGYAAVPVAAGAWNVFRDPNSGLIWVEAPIPAGGWHFDVTGTTNLPQTIFGWYVTDDGDTDLYGSELFDDPILLVTSGVGFDVPRVAFPLPRGAMGP